MARALHRAFSAVVALLLLASGIPNAKSVPDLAARTLPGGAAVLPLELFHGNSTRRPISAVRRPISAVRRHLHGHPTANAHMRLYDDLLTNGYYTTKLWIGTPPQKFALIVDSGSTVTYVPCSTCEQCGHHQDPRFQPDESSTYEPVKCNTACTCDKDKQQCTYERQYAEMSSSSGVLGKDVMSFGDESALRPQRAVFGCENVETGDLFSQHADGIMGLGRGPLSIMDQLVEKGVISDSFSLCYGGMDIGGGAMVLGGISPLPDMVFSRSDPVRSPYYNIELKELRVSGKSLGLNPKVFDSKHGTVLDSGTTYAYLPEEAFVALRDAITSKLHTLKRIHGPDPNYHDICFSGAGNDVSQLSKTFPEVEMVFGNGQKLQLSPENYLFRHSKVHGAYCLGIFQNGKDPTTLLGGIIVRNTLVTYDRQNQKIGFWKTNCSQLWEGLQSHGAPLPAPSVFDNHTSNGGLSPGPSPSGLQYYTLPGQFQVGRITFDMLLNVSYLDLVPHIKQLTELIGRELEVDVHQVHLVNFTSKGNTTWLKWGIFPAGPADIFSNTTALEIISRLEGHFRLPVNYGSYQLGDWKVEPPLRRTWLQQHLWAVILGISVVVLLGFATLLVWYFWRHKIAVTPYRPLGAPVPEQELQPL
ncbi:Aspartic peptidase A1 family protein [Dioscorea alata]|uniref:Aspartic peptidase A1 family protein n=1 Tax=Dioscorea alata TaxID=55571 RepID=A0ACB7TWN2_DIOAL|nr:Aspartic peptidase A1 family protein [Dioscorea alata]